MKPRLGCFMVVSTETTMPGSSGQLASAASYCTGPDAISRGASWLTRQLGDLASPNPLVAPFVDQQVQVVDERGL
jgi:hypothetical protein